MSYQVLARKWRPKTFDELIGQNQTARALINALESQRLHHAYLFTGTRGVGKTTIARILSKSLNCEKGITSSPCGECSSCTEIDQGNFIDLMEIDAASKTKVEDTRELLDNVQYRPTIGRYKVYLIDEVHMLSGHSFNALLKTLEEPPPHVIFLLATTDPQKLPPTVLSRCLQFHLKRMEENEIIDHLSMILTAEKISFDKKAIPPIAKGADGSMRDALSLLDQAIAFSGEHLTLESVLDMIGGIDQSYIFELLNAVINDNATELLSIIQNMSQYSPNYSEVMTDWLSLLHNIAVSQVSNISESEKVKQLAAEISAADLQLFYQLSLQAKADLPYAPYPKQGFEMAMLRILAFRPKTVLSNNTKTEGPKKKISSLGLNKETPLEDHRNSNRETNLSVHTSTTSSNNLPNNQFESSSSGGISEKDAVNYKNDSSIYKKNSSVETVSESKIDENFSSKIAQVVSEKRLELVSNSDAEPIGTKPEASELSKDTPLPNDKADELDEKHSSVSVDNVNLSSEIEQNVMTFTDAQGQRKKLYPDSPWISLENVSNNNWHFSVDQMEIGGNGYQVLINSLASYDSEKLTIHYLEKAKHLLTDNLETSLINALRSHYKTDKLRIELTSVDSLLDTPRDKQVILYQQKIDECYLKLVENPCVSHLQKEIGLNVEKKHIKLK